MDRLISEQDVLDAISKIGLKKSDTKEVQTVAECLRAVEALPSATPQPKMEREIITDDVYNRGLNDAWEVVYKLTLMGITTIYDIFDGLTYNSVIKNLSASEVIAKIKEYEDKQKIPSWIRSGVIDERTNGFCICPECSEF